MKKILSLLSVGATVSSLIATTPVVMAATNTAKQTNNKQAFAQKHGWPAQRGGQGPMLESQSKLLGITTDDLKSRLSSGKNFDQILTDLGISQDQWKAKLEAERATRNEEFKAKLTAEVAAGKLTQAQADKMSERLNNPPQFHPGTVAGKKGERQMPPQFLEEQSKLLGITTDDLKSRLSSGKNFDQILTDLGISQDQWKAKLNAQFEARKAEIKTKITAEVASGKLTQAQADKMLERMDQAPKGRMDNGHHFGSIKNQQK